MIRSLYFLSILFGSLAAAADWNQGPGPRFDFTADASAVPSTWSDTLGQNIVWKISLPETGQSTPIISGGRIFLTTMKPVEIDTKYSPDIVAWCFSARDGALLWQRAVPGGYQTKLSGPYGDASAPSPVTDGRRVWVLNPSGRLSCFDLDGNPVWSKAVTSTVYTQPVLFEGKLILHHQVYLPNETGAFLFGNADAPLEKWTQLQALDAATGERVWLTQCGVNMACVPLIQRLADGTAVLMVGRGGGHAPPEKPIGISLIRADTGEAIWSLPLAGFAATQTFSIVDDQALVFHGGEHLWIDAKTGTIARRVSLMENVPVRRWTPEGRTSVRETLGDAKARAMTEQSNLRVGDYHYFRSNPHNYIGRVNIKTGAVEYVEVPLQILRVPGKPEQALWRDTPNPKLWPVIALVPGNILLPNTLRNSRGLLVMGDVRSQGSGWGHVCAPIPTAFGQRVFMPLMCGLIFVVQADAAVLDENAILGMNDLGPLGEAFTRSSITTDGKRAYAHTIKELIAVGTPNAR